jgi:hypothetical protein
MWKSWVILLFKDGMIEWLDGLIDCLVYISNGMESALLYDKGKCMGRNIETGEVKVVI